MKHLKYLALLGAIALLGCIPNGGNGGNGEPPPPPPPPPVDDGLPFIDQLFPAIGLPGDQVVVAGSGFLETNRAAFAFTETDFQVISTDIAIVTVPFGLSGTEPLVTLSEQPQGAANSVRFRIQQDPLYSGPTYSRNRTPVDFPPDDPPELGCPLPVDPADFAVILPFDADGDGDLDLFLGTRSSFDVIRFQTGSCEFEFTDQISSEDLEGDGSDTRAAAAIDIDGDGDLDLFLARGPQGQGKTSVFWLNDGTTFTPTAAPLNGVTPGEPFWVDLGDYDLDGDLDILVTGLNPTGSNPPLSNTVLWRNNSGSFSDVARAAGIRDSVTDELNQRQGVFSDVDGDGDLDILFREGDRFYQNLLQ